jgi:hypothetical protein
LISPTDTATGQHDGCRDSPEREPSSRLLSRLVSWRKRVGQAFRATSEAAARHVELAHARKR